MPAQMSKLAGAKAEKRRGGGIISPVSGWHVASTTVRACHNSASLLPHLLPSCLNAWISALCRCTSASVAKRVLKSPKVSMKCRARPEYVLRSKREGWSSENRGYVVADDESCASTSVADLFAATERSTLQVDMIAVPAAAKAAYPYFLFTRRAASMTVHAVQYTSALWSVRGRDKHPHTHTRAGGRHSQLAPAGGRNGEADLPRCRTLGTPFAWTPSPARP